MSEEWNISNMHQTLVQWFPNGTSSLPRVEVCSMCTNNTKVTVHGCVLGYVETYTPGKWLLVLLVLKGTYILGQLFTSWMIIWCL